VIEVCSLPVSWVCLVWQVRDAGRDPTADRGVGTRHAWLHPDCWRKAAIETLGS
jgi:hypothetical protein